MMKIKDEYGVNCIFETPREAMIRRGYSIDDVNKKYPPIEEKKRKSKKIYPTEYKRKRKNLVSRSNICSQCSSDRFITVHHIDRNKHNNSIENLVVLCWSCHSLLHKHMKPEPPKKWKLDKSSDNNKSGFILPVREVKQTQS